MQDQKGSIVIRFSATSGSLQTSILPSSGFFAHFDGDLYVVPYLDSPITTPMNSSAMYSFAFSAMCNSSNLATSRQQHYAPSDPASSYVP